MSLQYKCVFSVFLHTVLSPLLSLLRTVCVDWIRIAELRSNRDRASDEQLHLQLLVLFITLVK